jgi:hypothetical protein
VHNTNIYALVAAPLAVPDGSMSRYHDKFPHHHTQVQRYSTPTLLHQTTCPERA